MRSPGGVILAVLALGSARPAAAVPSFAAQTGQPCAACHVGGLGPQLTPFGREFKLRGYTARATPFSVPLAAFLQTSFVHTQKDQQPPPAPAYGANDTLAIDQISLFVAGGFGNHLGAFIQNTYDGIAKAFHWDNLDVRATTKTRIAGHDAVLGLDLNNNPGVQDAFNTLPAWGFPYTTSTLAPAPAAAPLIGGLPQTVLGLSAYAWLDSRLYGELGAYRSLGAGFLTHAGVDPFTPGKIDGLAPYARLAWQAKAGPATWSLGAFLLDARLFPGRDETTGSTDGYLDLGLDASGHLVTGAGDVVTFNARYTAQDERLGASRLLGLASNEHDWLQDARADASYYWRNKYGATLGLFRTWGSADPLLYGGDRTGRPDSGGAVFELDATPFGDGRSPLGPRFNLRVGLQYTLYFQFNGAGRDFDGAGRAAADNNTFRVFTWVYY